MISPITAETFKALVFDAGMLLTNFDFSPATDAGSLAALIQSAEVQAESWRGATKGGINVQENSELDETKTQPDISIRNGIDVEHIDFAYRAELAPIFKDFSLHIACRESVAFVGKTGCGKSTLADIIMGFYNPQNGAVKVDGVPITENMFAWRKKIGYVPQRMTLFDDTIRNNIAFGVPPEQIDSRATQEKAVYGKTAGSPSFCPFHKVLENSFANAPANTVFSYLFEGLTSPAFL